MGDFSASLKPADPTGESLLAKERSGSSLLVPELASHLHPDSFLERQSQILQQLQQNKLFSKSRQDELSLPDRRKLRLERANALKSLAAKSGWTSQDYELATYLVDDGIESTTHSGLFHATLRHQGSDEQQAKWLPLFQNNSINGTYAHTELGHSSTTEVLETSVVWDKSINAFVMHTPTLTAAKWWTASLHGSATHAVVMANLHAADPSSAVPRPQGPHAFVVELRNPKTHKIHDGIQIGSIGTLDISPGNGDSYILFNNLHLPHESLLSRYTVIDIATGVYTRTATPIPPSPSITAELRARSIYQSRLALTRAITIATRWLSVRHEPADAHDSHSRVTSSLDHPTLQYLILPALATTFALHYTGAYMSRLASLTPSTMREGDSGRLSDIASLAPGLESLSTRLAARGITACRQALGPHASSPASGLHAPSLDLHTQSTEDDHALPQQTASYLLTAVTHVSRRVGPSRLLQYDPADHTERVVKEHLVSGRLRSAPPPLRVLARDEHIVLAFERRAAHLAVMAHSTRILAKRPWRELAHQLQLLSDAHAQAVLVRNFYRALHPGASGAARRAKVPEQAWPALRLCFRAFALQLMGENLVEFVAAAAFSKGTAEAIHARLSKVLAGLRPYTVPLAEAWQVPEYLLNSQLGRADGRVYEGLWARTLAQGKNGSKL